MKALFHWLDDRTGIKTLMHEALFERIPGGARWRYVWGSTLIFTFSIQVITGLFLWMAYSPSSQTAWESVYYIQFQMQFGWLLRGLHHFTAQAMIVLLALHLMQVIIDGAYRAPREVNFWLGLILMQITLGLSLTGYLLPWDQKGYWATRVATTLSSSVPVIGPEIQKLIVGGSNYGHHTLTRFFAMHAGVLPALMVGFLALHIYVFRRHGITVKDANRAPETTFWPDQVLKDAVACLMVLVVVLGFVFRNLPEVADDWSTLAENDRLGQYLGADLGAPADPSEDYKAARPEWYFLFLFQFLKYFPAESEVWGSIYIPGAVMGFMFLMPFIGRWKLGHRFNCAYIMILAVGAAGLTAAALRHDYYGENKEKFSRAVEDAETKRDRLLDLIEGPRGIGKPGALSLLRSDPKTRGPALFSRNCSQCHTFDGHDGTNVAVEKPTASDLGKFGTREWIRGFIVNPAGPKHFGPTVQGSFNGQPIGDRFTKGRMAKWAKENVENMQEKEISAIVEFLIAQGGRTDIPEVDKDLAELGAELFTDGSDNFETTCGDCHMAEVDGEEFGLADGAPELTRYASEEWLRDLLINPSSERHYGDRNAMPSYTDRMTPEDFEILLRWMRHRWYEPEGSAKSSEAEVPEEEPEKKE